MSEQPRGEQLEVINDPPVATRTGFGLPCESPPTPERFGLLYVATRATDGRTDRLNAILSRDEAASLVCNTLGVILAIYGEEHVLQPILDGARTIRDQVRATPFVNIE